MAIDISTRDRLYVSNKATSCFRKSATTSAVGSLEEQGCAATVNASGSILLGGLVENLVSLTILPCTYFVTTTRYTANGSGEESSPTSYAITIAYEHICPWRRMLQIHVLSMAAGKGE
jgi:hypothetical protein